MTWCLHRRRPITSDRRGARRSPTSWSAGSRMVLAMRLIRIGSTRSPDVTTKTRRFVSKRRSVTPRPALGQVSSRNSATSPSRRYASGRRAHASYSSSTEAEMPQYWLKPFGTTDPPRRVEPNWTVGADLDNLMIITGPATAKKPPQMGGGDKILFHAVGHVRLYAAGELTGSPR